MIKRYNVINPHKCLNGETPARYKNFKLDLGTFGGSITSHYLVEYLNEVQDGSLASRISTVFQTYNRNLKETVKCDLPRNLKLRLIKILFEEKKVWAEQTLKEHPKAQSCVLNILSAKKRNAISDTQEVTI